jgi:hypothetical protein
VAELSCHYIGGTEENRKNIKMKGRYRSRDYNTGPCELDGMLTIAPRISQFSTSVTRSPEF